jgi:ornithine--oxo-acid transaminase
MNVEQLLREHTGRNYELHREHVNPQFARVLSTIGYDRCYVRAQGQYLWDVEGAKYLDMLGGYATVNAGRNNPGIRQALVDFLLADQPSLVQMDAPLLAGVLAAEIKRRVPYPMEYVFFTNSGTEGIEAAIKFARCATGRAGLVHCVKAFHGLTAGSLSINGCDSFRDGFEPLLAGARAVPFDDLEALETALAGREAAAFVVEPIQGKGVNVPSPGYLAAAAALCRKYGTLFVADEVQTGVGRTGRFLALEHEPGVEPDIIVLAKGLSGGYVPVGAVLMRKAIYENVFSSMDRAVVHSSTFGQGSLAMICALASLEALDAGDLPANAERMGAMLLDGLRSMQSRFEFMHEVRGRGLMIGIQLGRPKSLTLRAAWSMIHAMDANLFAQAVTIPLLDTHHILTQVAGHNTDCVKLIPPLVIDESDVRWFLEGFEQVMVQLHQFPGPAWGILKKLGALALTRRPREAVGAR